MNVWEERPRMGTVPVMMQTPWKSTEQKTMILVGLILLQMKKNAQEGTVARQRLHAD